MIEDLGTIFIDLRILNLILGTIFVLVTVYWTSTKPFKQTVPLDVKVTNNISQVWGSFWNPALSYPFEGERISTADMLLFSSLVPMGLVVISSLIAHCLACHEPPPKESDNPTDQAYRPACASSPMFLFFARIMDRFTGLLESISLAIFVSIRFKLALGEPGPNYKEFGLQKANEAIFSFGSSFPSAHAAISFAGFSFASLVLWSDVAAPLIKMRGMHVFVLPLFLVCMAPLIMSTWIAVTRVQDYVHAPVDILAGAIIGAVTSVVIFYIHNTYLPELSCGYRIRMDNGNKPQKINKTDESKITPSKVEEPKTINDKTDESTSIGESNHLNESKTTDKSQIMNEPTSVEENESKRIEDLQISTD